MCRDAENVCFFQYLRPHLYIVGWNLWHAPNHMAVNCARALCVPYILGYQEVETHDASTFSSQALRSTCAYGLGMFCVAPRLQQFRYFICSGCISLG